MTTKAFTEMISMKYYSGGIDFDQSPRSLIDAGFAKESKR
jgi:hypothetical protein